MDIKIEFSRPMAVHFIGIGGVSMSGLAEILLFEGFTVSGSDRTESDLLDTLREKGATIHTPQAAENIPENTELVVYTAAISPDNPEFVAAQERKLPMMSRADLLGQIMAHYDGSVAVSGTHGKTTTSSMITEVLMAAGMDPTVTIGGMLSSIGGNIRVGKSPCFVAEACEYTNSFLSFFPKYTIITNIEAEHLDFFKDLADVRNSFHRFAGNTKADGTVVINAEIPDYTKITEGISAKTVSYGINDGDYHASGITFDEFGRATFTALRKEEEIGSFTLGVPGLHNVSNAMAVIALSDIMGADASAMKEGLLSFHGADRRFQIKGKTCGVTVVDDYAHHPTEIAATISAARLIPHHRLVIAFQPHTYSRTKAFLTEFADVLSKADLVVLSDIYAAREKNTIGITSKELLPLLEERGTECYYFPSFEEIEKFLLKKCMNNDLLITMGAGDIYKVGENLLGKG